MQTETLEGMQSASPTRTWRNEKTTATWQAIGGRDWPSDDTIRALEVLVAERGRQRLGECRREVAIGIEQVDRRQVAPLNARETLARVRKERQV